ncbi:2TM domain-containing protein [Paractinoplanes lichenicola]|uniref:2TM domain-containing protein n=1 Tax=Paractinoplanes lichenicola TaxID=2802976 RepID=A0ABS1VET8_9ACTN|nr:2TM domain-containing protein [Actinoplanes lichenicola]MBL7253208.1 2TM domain-containing protein [Actinoplanes lichenicola]
MKQNDSLIKWGLWSHIIWYVLANVGQVFTWNYATPDIFFWPLWSIVFWGLGLAIHIWAARRTLRAHALR